MSQPKVSILIPICNVERYLTQCLNSVVSQTLEDIQIICIDDGSSDSSPSIIAEYAKRDPRIKVITKPNSGYGDSMNKGLEAADGKYIGIVEPDDYVDEDMFEELYDMAESYGVEVVKTNYYEHMGASARREARDAIDRVIDPKDAYRVIDPAADSSIFLQKPCIWAALYRLDFLRTNNIMFLPTPGASYQDTGFNFKVWASAHKVYFSEEAYLHYRIDNEGSSVKDMKKVFAVNDEYAEIERYLREHEIIDKYGSIMEYAKYGAYYWNLQRLPYRFAKEFASRMRDEYSKAHDAGLLDWNLFSSRKAVALKQIMARPHLAAFMEGMLDKRHVVSRCFHSIFAALPLYKRTINLSDAAQELNTKNHVLARNISRINSACDVSDTLADNDISDNDTQENRMDITDKLTVIVPVYNVEEYLARCLDALLNQTVYVSIICVDDCSTDSSRDVLDGYAERYAQITVIKLERNSGLSAVRNIAMREASTPFVMFCDSDDTYEPDMCEVMYKSITENDTDLAMCEINVVYKANYEMRERDSSYYKLKYVGKHNIEQDMILKGDLSPVNKIFKKDLLDEYSLEFPEGLHYEDAYFCAAYLSIAHNAYFTKKKLYNYVRYPKSLMGTTFSKSTTQDFSIDHLRIAMKYYDFLTSNNLFNINCETFWSFFANYLSLAVYYAKSMRGRLHAVREARRFVKSHAVHFKMADKGIQTTLGRFGIWKWLLSKVTNKVRPVAGIQHKTTRDLSELVFDDRLLLQMMKLDERRCNR
jgi:glycosyltransferase involved in cell wall biosynthesis